MIEHLDIRDLGVISHASLPFSPGFTVLTGETGAGKTMVVTALGLLLGQRADTARVRQGQESTWVEGRFRADHLDAVRDRVAEVGGVVEDGEVVLARQVAGEGRSRAVVGGRQAPVSVLSDLAEHLVVVHGQSDQIRLKSESAQREALDRFAGRPVSDLLQRYREVHQSYLSQIARLRELTENEHAMAAEAQSLAQALERIEAVRPEAGEDEKLRQLSDRLEHVEELRQAASVAKQAVASDLSGVDSADARSLVDQAVRSLERMSARDSDLEPIATTLREALFQLDEASQSLSSYLSALTEGDSFDLETVMSRRASLTALCREFGPTLDDVLAYEKWANSRLLELDTSSEGKEQLQRSSDELREKMTELACELTALRKNAAALLGQKVTAELHALAMEDAQFLVTVEPRDFTQSGADQVAFALAPHSGAEPRPLGRGASGGELSRVMLALEVVIAEADPVPTFIFDEVDAGVGGQTALEIGRRLQRLAKNAQVICVTHLAQVAACADHHLSVVKDRTGEFTESSVTVLEGEARLREIARMLGGDGNSESALSHAQEMLTRESVSRLGGE